MCRVLDISECRGIGSEALRRALATPPALPALETLGLEGLAELDDQLLADITLALPGLLHLRISRCRSALRQTRCSECSVWLTIQAPDLP